MIETNVYSRKNIGVDEYQHYAEVDDKELMLDDNAYQAFIDVYHHMVQYNKDRGDDYITSVAIDELGNYLITHKCYETNIARVESVVRNDD